jgi:hypothetical protein
VPVRVARPMTRACDALDGPTAGVPRATRRRLDRALRAWRKAARALERAGTRRRLSSDCLGALRATLEEARARGREARDDM